MRALTLTQPWAGLVASGIKLVENRPRKMIKREDFGKPFAVHASREIHEHVYDMLRESAPELFEPGTRERWYPLSRVTSAILAVSTLENALYVGGCTRDAIRKALARIGLEEQHRFAFGPTIYVLDEMRRLAEPVTCRGWQGFWTVADDVAAKVEEQVARARR
jgi:hypothetical protein